MKKIFYLLLVFNSMFLNAFAQQDTPENNTNKLQRIWATSGLNNPESVIYHPASNNLFISNVNGSAVEKDGNGYISQASLNGIILKKRWIDGLNAPKGLAIYKNTLYVADIDTLVAIDIPSSTISRSYKVDDAQFLNDVAASDKGEIFVSDMFLNRIHRLVDGQFIIWLESPQLESPNGLHVKGKQLILGTWGVREEGFATKATGHLKSISLKDKSIISLGDTPIGNLDGVERASPNSYYVTDWVAGKLFEIDENGNAKLLLTLEQGMADLAVIAEQKLILLPMMKGNQLLAYKIKE